MKKKPNNKDENPKKDEGFPENLEYPESEDIYNQENKIAFTNEDVPEIKGKEGKTINNDLDVPGAELDDKDEAIGEEDEENNYYSLGGDNHNDLDEDKGE